MLKSTKQLRTIKKAFSILDQRVPYINYGGCGIFALEASKVLSKVGIKHKIAVTGVLENSFQNTKEYVQKNLKNKAANPKEEYLAVHHVLIYLEDKKVFIDSEGVYKLGLDKKNLTGQYCDNHLEDYISRKELSFMLKGKGWNSSFNRNRYKPVIRQHMQRLQSQLQTIN